MSTGEKRYASARYRQRTRRILSRTVFVHRGSRFRVHTSPYRRRHLRGHTIHTSTHQNDGYQQMLYADWHIFLLHDVHMTIAVSTGPPAAFPFPWSDCALSTVSMERLYPSVHIELVVVLGDLFRSHRGIGQLF